MSLTNALRGALSGELEWFKENQNQCSSETVQLTFQSALHHGKLDCIQYMVEHELVDIKDKPYCDVATQRGHYECLKYLHEKGCPFRKYTALIAMIRDDYKCLNYIRENGGEIHMPPA